MALCIVQGVLHKIPVSEGLAAPVMEALATMKSKVWCSCLMCSCCLIRPFLINMRPRHSIQFLGPSLALIHSVSSP